MNWEEQYSKLTESDKEQFARLIGILLQHSFILQDKLDSKTQSTHRNKDFRFVLAHFSLFEAYLHVGGWNIKFDDTFGYVVIDHKSGSHRRSLDKPTTNILFVLRLIYEEEREKLRMSNHVYTTLGELQRMLDVFGLQEKRLRKTTFQEVFATLKSYQIIDLLNGSEIADDLRILIYPSILYLISGERLRMIEQQLDESDEEEESDAEKEEVLL